MRKRDAAGRKRGTAGAVRASLSHFTFWRFLALWRLLALWQRAVVAVDRWRGKTFARCVGCGAFEEEITNTVCPCSQDGAHYYREVTRYGALATGAIAARPQLSPFDHGDTP